MTSDNENLEELCQVFLEADNGYRAIANKYVSKAPTHVADRPGAIKELLKARAKRDKAEREWSDAIMAFLQCG